MDEDKTYMAWALGMQDLGLSITLLKGGKTYSN
jgi:hypothetical protein